MNFDPLLGGNQPSYNIPQLEEEQNKISEKLEQLKRSRAQHTMQQAHTPVWDEIDRITSSLSDKEFRYLQNNQEFQESSARVQDLLQREYMRIMRPIVEGTKDGKDALDKHLTLLRRLVKSVKDEADKREALLNEYMTQYSDMTWQQFIDMKNKPKSRKK